MLEIHHPQKLPIFITFLTPAPQRLVQNNLYTCTMEAWLQSSNKEPMYGLACMPSPSSDTWLHLLSCYTNPYLNNLHISKHNKAIYALVALLDSHPSIGCYILMHTCCEYIFLHAINCRRNNPYICTHKNTINEIKASTL